MYELRAIVLFHFCIFIISNVVDLQVKIYGL